MYKPIKSHLQQASEHLTKLRFEACIDQIDFAFAERDDHQKAYHIGIRAAQISENSTKLLK